MPGPQNVNTRDLLCPLQDTLHAVVVVLWAYGCACASRVGMGATCMRTRGSQGKVFRQWAVSNGDPVRRFCDPRPASHGCRDVGENPRPIGCTVAGGIGSTVGGCHDKSSRIPFEQSDRPRCLPRPQQLPIGEPDPIPESTSGQRRQPEMQALYCSRIIDGFESSQ